VRNTFTVDYDIIRIIDGYSLPHRVDLLCDCWFTSKPCARISRTRLALSTFCQEIWEMIYSHWSIQQNKTLHAFVMCRSFHLLTLEIVFFLWNNYSINIAFISIFIFNSLEIRSCDWTVFNFKKLRL
jgi:hypothetical protein